MNKLCSEMFVNILYRQKRNDNYDISITHVLFPDLHYNAFGSSVALLCHNSKEHNIHIFVMMCK